MKSPAESHRTDQPAQRRRWRRAALLAGVLAALAALYAALGALLAPVLIARAIERHDAHTPGVEIRVGAVRVQPFRLRVELAEVRASSTRGQGTFSAPRVLLDLRPATLLQRAPVVKRLAIEQPSAVFALPACYRYGTAQYACPNFEASVGYLDLLRIARVALDDGRLELIGAGGAAERRWILDDIRIRAQDIAPGAAARYAIDVGDVAGTRLSLDGVLSIDAREAHGQLAVAGLDPDTLGTDADLAAVDGTYTAAFDAAAAALHVSARLHLGETPHLDARLDRAPDASALQLENVPAAVLSAFAGRAFGRGLAAGRIDVAVERRRINGQFDGSLGIAADGLVLADGSGELPLDLAHALLEDARGRLEFHVPLVAGTDDDLGGAVAQALRMAMARLTEHPFEALGPLVGRTAEELRSLEFEPGSAEPTDSMLATLDALAEVLLARPGLALRVPAGFDPELDRDALAVRQVELHVALATAGPSFRTHPEPLDFAAARVQDVLEEFARERLAAAERATIRSRFGAGRQGKAYYRALFEALVDNEQITPAALERLARFRGNVISDGLAARGIPPERIARAQAMPVAATAGHAVTLTAGLLTAVSLPSSAP
jgi:hypothetical protein